jgi:hypothetical protein
MIYVDPLKEYAVVQIKHEARKYGVRWCHLSDTDNDTEALHKFAASIGCARSWFQTGVNGIFPHYDLTPRYRLRAIQAGARQLTYGQAVEISVRQVEERRQMAKGDKRYGRVINRHGRVVGIMGTRRVRGVSARV